MKQSSKRYEEEIVRTKLKQRNNVRINVGMEIGYDEEDAPVVDSKRVRELE
jgi:hypothetical protein